ncbi:unnamed protein product [Rotaria socialis]|uniref:Uncharacterized protein n=1 Tax=Rotaria socialis TaxID=392032 RepID=A0A820TJ57_9BILA|nr:unnamed protein product [Rotaria socialis]CAF3629583.1 unnamed protein product [Rotaria socialis]CAF4434775.1 unnamed protein product [Rotaria socialis]CAF4475829.1 unnamed protein product [Rotaria socialis]
MGASPSGICPMHMRIPVNPVLQPGCNRERFSTETRRNYERQLDVVNRRIANGQPVDSESLYKDDVTMQFYVAQYRGYHYNIAKWGDTQRRDHRKSRKLSGPVYSMSVPTTNTREESALTLSEIFLAFQAPAAWRYPNYTFTSLADLVQQAYTNDYVRFHHMIRSEDLILKPRWNRDRKAERPYSGVVYVLLHPIGDYAASDAAEQQSPNHLTSLNYSGRVQIPVVIAPERETSFPGYIPKDRLVYQHVARYPSFEHEWRQNFYTKYGLTERLYQELSKLLDNHPPHSKERIQTELLLAEWLCCYHGLRLVELARRIAEDD